MESESGGKRKKKVCYTGMEEPPLLRQLKGILSEYPDGGQILKELIQNAEDAGAKEVKILYDDRRVNCDINENTPSFTKFFKGPALCVYNNEVFTDKDWRGIRMIYSSLKEEDRLKVGRYGLGFKSVFHITDYPCVVSGSHLLLIDPQRSEKSNDEVNAMIEISDIKGNEDGLDAEAFWTAFDGMFGVHRGIVKEGYFSGTLFWFPLRELKSKLSHTIYDESKIMNLFKGFETEASSILIFLKTLERISFCKRKRESNSISELIEVEMIDTTGAVMRERKAFHEEVGKAISQCITEDISYRTRMAVRSTVSGKTELTEWMIVNYFISKSASPAFRKLIQDRSLGYSPYVGVAVPLSQKSRSFQGHIFCFLPLPREGMQLTGLPVHINAYFALSQNRHHLKWETDEQQGKIDDNSILWNQFLIKEGLPRAYLEVIAFAIEISKKCGNDETSVKMVYDCLPHSIETKHNWKMLEKELFRRLGEVQFMYSRRTCSWISVKQACFATFSELPLDLVHIQTSVQQCLCRLGLNYVNVPKELFDTLKGRIPGIHDLTPESLSLLLKQSSSYMGMSNSEKLNVLTYLLTDKTNYKRLGGIELLPVFSGEWKYFNKRDKPVYLCPDEVRNIFPGLENRLLADSSQTGKYVFKHLQHICVKGIFQIKQATPADVAQLLELVFECHFRSSSDRQLTSKSTLTVSWIQNVWHYLKCVDIVCYFKDIEIVPLLRKGTWGSPQIIDLVKMSDVLLVQSHKNDSLSEEVCKCLEHFGVTILPSIPSWMPEDKVKTSIFWPTEKSVVHLLETLETSSKRKQHVSVFNRNCEWSDKQELVSYLVTCQYHISSTAAQFLRDLQLFRVVDFTTEVGNAASISQCGRYSSCKGYPENVRLPYPCLIVSNNSHMIMEQLGAKKVSLDCLVLATLDCLVKEQPRYTDYTSTFMTYFLNRFGLFQSNKTIIECASNVEFLTTGLYRKKPSDLYDPSDSHLRELLQGEALLPNDNLSSNEIQILKILGMKNQDDINADIILKVATTLNTWTKKGIHDETVKRKADALMKTLVEKPSIVNEVTRNGSSLGKCLNGFACIPVQTSRWLSYPTCLEWFSQKSLLVKPCEVRNVSMYQLIGATMPLVVCSSELLNKNFKWKDTPPPVKVLDQLMMIKRCYSVQSRPEILTSLKAIYEFLYSGHSKLTERDHTVFADKEWIWTGHGFSSSKFIILQRAEGDIDLKPYYYTLPKDFCHMQMLFASFGCLQKQNADVLLDTLACIRFSKHKTDKDLNRDRQIVRNILDRFAADIHKGANFNESKILMMVQDINPNVLTLLPVSECTYNDDPVCLNDDYSSIHIVHKMIPESTAKALGVKSMKQRVLLEAEELNVEECGQEEHITARMHSLLDGYTDGLSVPKELIQNADDAGASVVKFLYDERQNCHLKQKVFSEEMKDFQGPALWVFNDATFTQADLANIQKLNGATKLNDEKKIGKFGLGFCSVYNVTDLPSFITGSNIVFFDPHKKNLGHGYRTERKGLKFKLPNSTLTAGYSDQFMPYSQVFDCNILEERFSGYNGTLFRLPLRTKQQARESQICPTSYTKDEMEKLLEMFIKAAGNMLIFSQNVKKLEIFHLDKNEKCASKMSMIYSVEKKTLSIHDGIFDEVTHSILSRVAEIMKHPSDFKEVHKSVILQKLGKDAKKVISNIGEVQQNSKTTWITSWAKGTEQSMDIYRKGSLIGAIPLAAVAMACEESDEITPLALEKLPSGFYKVGHAFCFLPLPLQTKLPVQINGSFTVTSDRRQLVSLTEDDKDNKQSAWNDALMKDAVVKAYIHLLVTLSYKKLNISYRYRYYDMWPASCSHLVTPFKESFYRNILSRNIRVFQVCQSWLSFQDIVYLDPQLRQSEIGELAFEVVSHFKPRSRKTLVEMPRFVIKALRQYNKENVKKLKSSKIDESEFFMIFFERIHDPFWQNRLIDRNMLIAAALNSCYYNVHKAIGNTNCIPTEPENILRKPLDLVHPKSALSDLFYEKEGVFPLNASQFRSGTVLNILVQLGMHQTVLPENLLVNRCYSVMKIAQVCCSCSYERCAKILEYLSADAVTSQLKSTTLQKIREIDMLPVLCRPNTWAFPWEADSHLSLVKNFDYKACCNKHSCQRNSYVLGKPSLLYRENCKDYVGMVQYIADESIISNAKAHGRDVDVFKLLEVKSLDETLIQELVKQTTILIETYKDFDLQYNEMKRVHGKMFDHFENILSSSTEHSAEKLKSLECLQNKNIVLIGRNLINSSKVAFEMKRECKPLLYRLPDSDAMSRTFIYKQLGVKNIFDIDDILAVIELKRQYWGNDIAKDIDEINGLLILLEDYMTTKEIHYDELSNKHDLILAPDNHSQLYPTYELVIENEKFETSSTMKIIHPSVSALTAARLGVKAKKERCFADMSVGIPFGQSEKLVTRIHNLLKAYPCDSSIMKELLQNADDAEATEINFIKDYRNHSTERIFGSPLLQGPSLCVFNNSFFTQKDIVGIHNLGEGSKSIDPTKVGQYGVGFNAVYHLTDTPSFLTKGPDFDSGGRLCILDPLCKHVPKANALEPGQMCKVDSVKRNFPDVLLGYSTDQLLARDKGTLFRFPLRKTKSDLSIQEEVSTESMDAILSDFVKEMCDALMFLRNVKCIKISDITSGVLIEQYSVNISLSQTAHNNRKLFFERIKHTAEDIKEAAGLQHDMTPFDTKYEMQIDDTKKITKRFLIVHMFGFKCTSESADLKDKFQKGHIRQLPLGSVAVPLSEVFVKDKDLPLPKVQNKRLTSSDHIEGKAFCMLPLPIKTGLPIHVNGHFVLDHEARREVCKDGDGRKWNDYLMENTIVPAWTIALHHIQSSVVSAVRKSGNWYHVNELLKHYHDRFPNYKDIPDSIWRNLAKMFYAQAIQMTSSLFPVINDRKWIKSDFTDTKTAEQKERFCISWTHVSLLGNSFHGVFDDIKLHLKKMYTNWDIRESESIILGNILRNLGMKLIGSPQFILDSVLEAGLENIPTASPEYLMRFLKSFDSEYEGHCTVGKIGDLIKNTCYMSEENFRRVLHYIKLHPEYITIIEGLPVLLTADNRLNVISKTVCVFATPYWKLLQASGHLFLHEQVLDLMSDSPLFETGYCKLFTTDDLLKLLPDNLTEDELGTAAIVSWNKARGVPLLKEWVEQFYDFLREQSLNNTRSGIDHKLFQQQITVLGSWSFLPIKDGKDKFDLVPFSKSYYAFHLSHSYKNDQIKVLNKLQLPKVDTDFLKHCSYSSDVISAVKRCVATPENSMALLQCLVMHKRRLSKCKDLLDDDVSDILSYFERQLESIDENDTGENAKSLLKQLPLFLTQHGTYTSLCDVRNIVLLPSDIPLDGLDVWAHSFSTTMLKKKDGLNKLYQFLGLKTLSILTVYAENILPTFTGIPENHWMVHIKYLRNNLRNSLEFDEEQNRVIDRLKKLAFIDIKGLKKRVNELYSPENELFRVMKNEADFPPHELRESDWNRFLQVLGLKVEVTDEMMLHFAELIQSEGTYNVSDDVRKKSNALIRTLLFNPPESGWKKKTLQLLSNIRCAVPYTVDKEISDIFPQFENASRLISLRDTVSGTEQNVRLCWTCVCFIPSDTCDSLCQADRNSLGVLDRPTTDSVVRHCQNVCGTIKNLIEDDRIENDCVASQMRCIYEYLSLSKKDILLQKERLQNIPIVHLYEERKMVSVNDIVIDLQSYGEVRPYLFRAPVYYGMYHNLFLNLGSRKTASFEHYVRILQQIKEHVKEEQMNVAELKVVRRTLDNMFQTLENSNANETELQQLYLPNTGRRLVNSRSLIVSDNKLLEKRLKDNLSIDYFIGFPALEMFIMDPVPLFKRLPEHLQPTFLTKNVQEVICEDKMQVAECSRKARHIQRLFHADEFANSICRLVKHLFTCAEIEFKESHAISIGEKLSSVRASRVEGLETVLYYRGNMVKGSERVKSCFFETEKDNDQEFINFYFRDNEDDESITSIISCNDGLADLVDLCTDKRLDKFTMRIVTTLIALEDYQKFQDLLDESNIDPYDALQGRVGSVFPKPGTYVEFKFLPFLEQGIKPFEEHEFESVAMELEDSLDTEEAEDQEPLFIYVHIIQEIKVDEISSDIKRLYAVDTGDPYRWSEIVPVYRLYRFIRKVNPGNEIQVYDDDAKFDLPFDENCRRLREILKEAWQLPKDDWKRIKRRLLLEWHPDKNKGRETYCTKVFQYIQIIISRLENGDDIEEDIDNEMKRGPSGTPAGQYYDNINRRARKHARQFKNDINDYNNSQRSWSHGHESRAGEKMSDRHEAKRWMRQAKKDLETAKEMISAVADIHSFNWICYTCHQASEKSLKAAWFYKDANKIPRSSHSLTSLAYGFSDDIYRQAELLDRRLGQHTRMRYPDTVSRPKIPSDIFNEEIAVFSIEAANKIIQLTEAYIQ